MRHIGWLLTSKSAGAAAFETLSELALEYATATGRELQFFGLRHKVLETFDQVFQVVTVMMQELHEFGLAASAEESARVRGPCQLERPRH